MRCWIRKDLSPGERSKSKLMLVALKAIVAIDMMMLAYEAVFDAAVACATNIA